MVAFAGPPVGWDAFSVENSDILWFAAQTNQKPGQETGQAGVEGATDAIDGLDRVFELGFDPGIGRVVGPVSQPRQERTWIRPQPIRHIKDL